MDQTNWSIGALLYSHNQRSKLNSAVKIFVSSLNAAVGREFFPSSHISFKVKLSLKKVKRERFCRHFCFCFLKKAFDYPVQYGFGGTAN